MTTRPPGRRTRAVSVSTVSGSRTWLMSVWATATSKLPAGRLSSCASPMSNSMRSPTRSSAASRTAAAMNAGLWSIPTTVPCEALPRGDRARHDAGTAADIQNRCRARQVDEVEVRVAVSDERRIATSKLQPVDEPLDRRGVLLVDELHRVVSVDLCRRHGPSVGSGIFTSSACDPRARCARRMHAHHVKRSKKRQKSETVGSNRSPGGRAAAG